MTKKLIIHFDPQGDLLEIRFGKAAPAYYMELGDDVFERRDEKTGDISGYAIFNFQKRKDAARRDIELNLPLKP